MSLLTPQALLAGPLSSEAFARDHDSRVTQFKRPTERGMMIYLLNIKSLIASSHLPRFLPCGFSRISLSIEIDGISSFDSSTTGREISVAKSAGRSTDC